MRYDGPPGMMLDLVGPSPDGVSLEWGHPYADAQPYKYSGNNPSRHVDPSGLFFGCVGLSGFTGLLIGVSGSAMYCWDNCGNSGVVVCGGAGLAQGLSVGVGGAIGQGCLPRCPAGQFTIQLSGFLGGSVSISDSGLAGGGTIGLGGGGAITLEGCKLL